jgi:excisionase family DNA binding protein
VTSTPKITPANPQPKPPVAYSIPEAARAASIGTTKLRLEIRAGRLRARKLGKRSLVTADDLEAWAMALPDLHDVVSAPVAKRVARAEVTET